MLVVFRNIIKLLITRAAAITGNWVGGQIRHSLTGESVQTINFTFVTENGRKMSNFPVATKFYPALLFSLIGKPRWLFAFLGGVLTGGLVDDRYESLWLEWFIEPITGSRGSTSEQGITVPRP
jgi:hypothetical protein